MAFADRLWVSVVLAGLLMLWALFLTCLLCWICCTRHAVLVRCFKWLCKVAWQWRSIRSKSKGADSDGLLLKIDELADAQRLGRVRSMFPVMAAMLPYIIIRNLGTALDIASAKDIEALLRRGTIVWVWPLEILAVFFFLRPASLTKSALRFGFVLTLLRGLYDAMTIRIDGGDGAVTVLSDNYVFMLTQITRVWYAIILQDTYFVMISYIVVLIPTLIVHIVQQHDEAFAVSVLEIAFAIFVIVMSATAERSTKAGIRANLQARCAEALAGAADALLSSVCDAVAHLTDSYDFIKDSPQLSALLLRDPSVPLKGNFCDLLMDETQSQAFISFMRVAEDREGDTLLARTMHVTMNDVNKTRVLVQLFHTTCLGTEGGKRVHLVGIRDVGGERFPPASHELPGDAHEIQVATAQGAQAAQLEAISEDSARMSSSDTESLTGWAQAADPATENVKVWVNILEPGLPMVAWTGAFLGLVGPAVRVNESFTSLIPSQKERSKTDKQLQQLGNRWLYANDLAQEPAKLQLTLETKLVGTVFAEVSVEPELDEERQVADDDQFIVVLEFTSWQRVRSQKRARSTGERKLSKRRAAPAPVLATPSADPVEPPRRQKNVVCL